MKNVTTSGESGFQKVVFENTVDILAGGAHIDPASATQFATTKVIPAGTLVGVKENDGMHKIVAITATYSATPLVGVKENDGMHKIVAITDADGEGGNPVTYSATPLGLTHFDVVLDDMPFVAVVLSGTVRIDALPDAEKANWKDISAKLPRITFVK